MVIERTGSATAEIVSAAVIPVMQVFDLVRRDESRGVSVIDVTRYFNDEISELSPLPGGMKQGKLE